MEWKQSTTVGLDGMIELRVIPNFLPGQVVEVQIREEADHGISDKSQARKPGSAAGRIKIHEDFDAPLTEFEPYI